MNATRYVGIARQQKTTGWQHAAACRGTDQTAWFPPPGSAGRNNVADAKAVCAGCPVRDECLEYALAFPPEKFGVWGGKSERQRRLLRRK